MCPSVFYDFDIIAQSGQNNIVTIEQGASINDAGKVAFLASQSGGQSVYVGDGVTAPQIVSFPTPNSTRTYGRELQINNSNQVAAIDITTVGAQRLARIWDANNPGTNTIIGRSSTPRLDVTHFDGLGNFTSITNDGQLAFAGLENPEDDDAFWEVQLSNSFVDRRDIFNPTTQVTEITIPPAAFFRMMAADGDRAVVANRQGAKTEITWFDITGLDTSDILASTASGWSQLGIRPGISDDGSIVVFYGDNGVDSGIFASVATSSGRMLVEVATDLDFDSFEPDMRVAVNSTHRGEAFVDADGNGVFDGGESFTDANNNGRYDPDQRAVTVVYIATMNGVRGIYSTRLNFYGDDTGPYDPEDPKRLKASKPTAVAEVGELIPGLGAITDLSINDAVNNHDRGEIAFWAAAGGSQAVVRARPREVVYLDFNPVGNFSADPGFGLQIFANDLNMPPVWPGNLDSVFSELAPNRPDLTGANVPTIMTDIAAWVQNAFTSRGARVKVLDSVSTPVAPQNGRFTRVFIGDGPHGGSQGDSGLDGIAAAVDLFNQDIAQSGSSVSLFGQDTVLVFADNTFRLSSGKFTDPSGNPVSLDAGPATPGHIPVSEVVNAIASVVAHEIGHSFGLLHLLNSRNDLIMNSNTDPDELRSLQVFSTAPVLREGSATDAQNDQLRLAASTGSDNRSLVRTPPSPEALSLLNRDRFRMGVGFPVGTVTVTSAVLGIIPLGEDHVAPEIVDLGAGDLATLLDREIDVREGDQVFLVASTDGLRADIVSVSPGFGGDVASINLTNALLTVADQRIRGDLFDENGQPAPTSLEIFQFTDEGPVLIGNVGSVGENLPPVANDDQAATAQGAPVVIAVLDNDSDADGQLDPASLVIVAGPANGVAVANNDGTVTYTPNPTFAGVDSFTYRVRDNEGAESNIATVTITVTAANQPPVAADDQAATAQGAPVVIAVLDNDSDADGQLDPASLVIVAGPANGVAVANNDGTVTYTPNAGFLGVDTFVYRVRDDQGALSNEATVTIDVRAPLRVEQILVNGGELQRSNLTRIEVTFTQDTNLGDLIADGSIVEIVEVYAISLAPGKVTLPASHFAWDDATRTLAVDLTVDGFGGSPWTLLADDHYELRLDVARIHAEGADVPLVDDDGEADGIYTIDFHRLEGDYNGNRAVDAGDRAQWYNRDVVRFGASVGQAGYNVAFDLDGDGIITTADYLIWFRNRYGRRLP